MSYFQDPDFQRRLIAFLCRDRRFLRECSIFLDANDFKPHRDEGPELWIIASSALEYWRKYGEPIGGMLRAEMLDHARQSGLQGRAKERLLEVVERVSRKSLLVAGEAIAEKVLAYKRARAKDSAVRKLLEMQEAGKLTDERWLQICMEAVERFGNKSYEVTDFFKTLDKRISRRLVQRRIRYPYLMIEAFDERTRAIARKQLGLWFGYLGIGKTQALIHTALAYVLQAYNVLYFTLEDTQEDVEDRFDANLSMLPVQRLNEMPGRLRRRFARFHRLVRSKLKIIDGSDGGMSVAQMDEIWAREAARGFAADAVIIDYDDEIEPPRPQKERRMEFADIYRALRRFAARRSLFLWTAAQTSRNTEGQKVITGSKVAEDISKIRKAFLAIGVGQGTWGEKSRYLWAAKSKNGRDHFGVQVMTDYDRGTFYDRHATEAKAREQAEEEAEADSEENVDA
jgi:predicted transcriptional regulator